jgi:hypothetical protein
MPSVATQPMAQMICASPALARAELRYVIAYQALRQSLSNDGQKNLVVEADNFVRQTTDACGIPKSGALNREPTAGEVGCIQSRFNAKRNELVGRLGGDALEEGSLTPEQAMAIQTALQGKGYLPSDADIDGVFGPVTRSAILRWQNAVGVRQTGFGSQAMLDALSR